jgi:uncharacterized protein
MKTKLLVWALLFLSMGATAPLLAQQPVVDYLNLLNAGKDVSNKLSNTQQGVFEYLKAIKAKAEKGDAQAQDVLGDCYSTGDWGMPRKSEAAKWFRKAADQGYIIAQYNLGLMYAKGDGIPQNYSEAINWYTKAADQGNANAQIQLAQIYDSGKGVARDYAESAKWYRKAANQGIAVAQHNLGIDYFGGFGVIKDYVEADKWFNLASAQGLDIANKYLSAIEQSMTPEQIAEAQQMAREFTPSKESNITTPASPDSPIASGSGFFITDDGYLITNNHVVKIGTKIRLITSAGLIEAKVINVDATNDLALLKAKGKFLPLPITTSRSVQLGSTVTTVGFPDPSLQGFAPKLAKGEIASLSGLADDVRYFQISVPVQHGNSGGALVDEQGNVVGVVSARLGITIAEAKTSDELPENVNYAIKSSLLLNFLESTPEISAKLETPNTTDEKFSDVVKSAQNAAVLVLVY